MAIAYDSIGQVCVTCFAGGLQVNAPCKLAANNFVAACTDGDAIEGVVLVLKDNIATVAVKGFVTLPYAGNAPTLGYCPLAGNGQGKVKMLAGAREHLVFNVNTTKKTVTFCL